MSDLIRRQDALDTLNAEFRNTTDSDDWDGLEKAMQLVSNIPSAEPERRWIPVTEALPIDGSLVIACSPYGGITIVNFRKGISQEDRTKMKNGEIDDPSEETWCLSEGYSKSKRSDLFKEEDEWGNNQKAYAWGYGPYHYSGQSFVAWMPLPEPYRGK